jgi:hypothetical protein
LNFALAIANFSVQIFLLFLPLFANLKPKADETAQKNENVFKKCVRPFYILLRSERFGQKNQNRCTLLATNPTVKDV